MKRIHRASDELEERISELEQAEAGVRGQLNALAGELAAIDLVIDQAELIPAAANAA